MKALLFWIVYFYIGASLLAQPQQRDGGLFIQNIYVKGQLFRPENGQWINKTGTSKFINKKLIVHHYLLDKKGNQSKYELGRIKPSDYDLVKQPILPYALFLPPHVNKKETPAQRIVLIYDVDTMTIDFLDVPERLIYQPIMLNAIHFKPGNFSFSLYDQQEMAPKEKMEALWLNYYTYQGITPEAEPYLVKYGKLKYRLARYVKNEYKYIVPQIIIDQYSPYEVYIKLDGNFLGHIAEEQIQETILNLFFKIEIFENGEWKEKVYGIGLDYKKFGEEIGSNYFRCKFQQFTSTDKFAPSGFKPGKYRVKLITEEKEIITSNAFYLGMVEPNKSAPYQTLYRENLGFPNYKLDGSDNIHIQTAFLPLKYNDSLDLEHAVYHFHYFWTPKFDTNHYPAHPENEYTKHFIPLVSSRKVTINDEPYNGRIKFAFSSTSFGLNQRITQHDIYCIDYVNGVPIKSKVLIDVDLGTETTPARPN